MHDHVWVIGGVSRAGKTTRARLISQKFNLQAIDMDDEVLDFLKTNLTIPAWVAQHGWQKFREVERTVYHAFQPKPGMVIALGGGAVLQESVANITKKWGFHGCLVCCRRVLLQRWQASTLFRSQSNYLVDIESRQRAWQAWSNHQWCEDFDLMCQQMQALID